MSGGALAMLAEPPADVAIEREVLGERLAPQGAAPDDVGVLIVHQTIVDAPLLDHYPRLRGVVRLGVGFDQVDLAAAAQRGVVVANVPDFCTAEVADTAMAMILALVRGVVEVGELTRDAPGTWQSHALPRIRRTSTVTLGVVGAGRIGSAVLERAGAFGMRRLFFDPYVDARPGCMRSGELTGLLAESHIVTLHALLDETTRGMVDRAFLDAMHPGAALVNTARGGLVDDEGTLLEALREGRLSGVAVDVLAKEPPDGSPLFDAWRRGEAGVHGRIIVNPHTAYHSREAAIEVRRSAAEEAARILRGEQPRNPVPAVTTHDL